MNPPPLRPSSPVDLDLFCDSLIIEITRETIESGNYAQTINHLLPLTDTIDRVKWYRGKLAFFVSGYDHDVRELVEIPEVRKHFTEVTKIWPHWFWFLLRGHDFIRTIVLMLTKTTPQRNEFGAVYFNDFSEFSDVLTDLFERGNALFVSYQISKEAAKASCDEVMHDLLQGMYSEPHDP